MDTLTHALLPYAAATALRRPGPERVALAIGAVAPDVDGLFAWLSHADPALYGLTHRGWSHTLWGAPLLAFLLYSLLRSPLLSRRFPRLASLAWDRGVVVALILGALSHLLLDAITITGVPALSPFDQDRWSLNFYFYSAVWALPVSAFVLWRRFRGRLSERGVLRGALFVLAILAVLGGLRLATYPFAAPADAFVQPRPTDWEWTVATPRPGGWDVTLWRWGDPVRTVPVEGNATAEAAAAVAAAKRDGPFVAWWWGTSRALVVNATREEADAPGPGNASRGAWLVEFRDAAQLAEPWDRPYWIRPLIGDPGSPWERDAIVFRVPDGGDAVLVERPRGFLFG